MLPELTDPDFFGGEMVEGLENDDVLQQATVVGSSNVTGHAGQPLHVLGRIGFALAAMTESHDAQKNRRPIEKVFPVSKRLHFNTVFPTSSLFINDINIAINWVRTSVFF